MDCRTCDLTFCSDVCESSSLGLVQSVSPRPSATCGPRMEVEVVVAWWFNLREDAAGSASDLTFPLRRLRLLPLWQQVHRLALVVGVGISGIGSPSSNGAVESGEVRSISGRSNLSCATSDLKFPQPQPQLQRSSSSGCPSLSTQRPGVRPGPVLHSPPERVRKLGHWRQRFGQC